MLLLPLILCCYLLKAAYAFDGDHNHHQHFDNGGRFGGRGDFGFLRRRDGLYRNDPFFYANDSYPFRHYGDGDFYYLDGGRRRRDPPPFYNDAPLYFDQGLYADGSVYDGSTGAGYVPPPP